MIFDYDFLSDCPSFMHDIAIRYVQDCQALMERGVCELASSFFTVKFLFTCRIRKIDV